MANRGPCAVRLCKFEVRNFKAVEYASFEWDDLILLIGRNNAGKSCILQALEWFLGGSQIRDPTLFRGNQTDEENAIELIGHFADLSEREQQAQAVRGRMLEERWIIKKSFWRDNDEGDPGRGGSWREQYYSYSVDETFAGWPDQANSWSSFPAKYEDLIEQIPNRGPRPNAQTREALQELVRRQKPHLVDLAPPTWKPNPGGGGNWKSNANSIVPRFIFVRAVHEAGDEAISKEASTYGRIVDLIVERKLMHRPEVEALRKQIQTVLDLFRPDSEHPEQQAEEIRELEGRINDRLGEVIGGIASIVTQEPDIRPILLPSTTLVIRDSEHAVDTPVPHQGHGLQRTLIMALLQILVEHQTEQAQEDEAELADGYEARPVVLAIEEPELYMHPQMQRKMRDALYRLASERRFQVICTTHSPVFLDMSQRHKCIVRVARNADSKVEFSQVTSELFPSDAETDEKNRLRLVGWFHPTVNEIFFAERVVLLEERSAIAAFERGAELTGLFERHPPARRDVTPVDCQGKNNIPMFQRVLNHFAIPYTVIHDEDSGNPAAESMNLRIQSLLGSNRRYAISPTNLEGLLGYAAAGKDKPYQAVKRVEELAATESLPADFLTALNWVYFGQESEPAP